MKVDWKKLTPKEAFDSIKEAPNVLSEWTPNAKSGLNRPIMQAGYLGVYHSHERMTPKMQPAAIVYQWRDTKNKFAWATCIALRGLKIDRTTSADEWEDNPVLFDTVEEAMTACDKALNDAGCLLC